MYSLYDDQTNIKQGFSTLFSSYAFSIEKLHFLFIKIYIWITFEYIWSDDIWKLINIPTNSNILSTFPNVSIDSGVENAGCNYEAVDLTFIGPSELNFNSYTIMIWHVIHLL
jgi:hypothetical protein